MAKLSPESSKLHDLTTQALQDSPEGSQKSFNQQDLITLGSLQDATELMPLIQELVSHQLFRTLKAERTLFWTPRPRDLAASLSNLDQDERIIYEAIENSETNGIWLKRLKVSTGVAAGNVPKIIKKLEGGQLIKSIKSVKAPAQRIYMLFHLAPAEDVTGGSFFDAGDLDEGLVEELSNLIIFHVRSQSWIDIKPKKARREQSPIDLDGDDDQQANGTNKRKRTNDDATSKKRSKSEPQPLITQIPFPPGTRGYPTATTIHTFITTSQAIRASKASSLTVREIQEIINVLVWDDKLEKVGGGYRTVLGVQFKGPGSFDDGGAVEEVGNGLTEAPCGRCPVFDLCKPGGPVNAGNCVYFEQWLSKG